MPDIRGSPNNLRGGEEFFFFYCMKNSGEGVQIFRLLHEKQWEGEIFIRNYKRGLP